MSRWEFYVLTGERSALLEGEAKLDPEAPDAYGLRIRRRRLYDARR